MIINPDESGGGVPGGSESIPGNSDDNDDNTADTSDYLDDGGETDGYGSIGDDDDLDPGNSESGMPGGGDPANDTVSPSPNEDGDGDEVTVNPDGLVSIDENQLSGDYENVEDVTDEVRSIIGDGSNETPQVGETTALEEQLRNLRESLIRVDESTGDSSSGRLLAAGVAGVVVVVATGVAALAGGDDE